MKTSNTKKRRLAALNSYLPAAADISPAPNKPANAAQPAALAAVAAAAAAQVAAKQQQQPQHAGQQQAIAAADEPDAFPYNSLPEALASSQAAAKLHLPGAASCRGSVDDLLEQLMTPNMPPATARSMISNRTVDKSVVLENPTAKLNITRPSKGRRQQQLTAQLLPRAQRIALCQLPPTGVDYAALLPLHELWSKYAAEQLAGKAEPERLLQGLDWHGAVLRVTSCKNPIYVGRAGIVAKATANTFVMVAPDGRSSVVPLKGAVLECMVPGLEHAVQLSSSGGMAKLQCRMLLEGAQS